MTNDSNEHVIIESGQYASEAERLAQDPAIRDMAATLPADVDTSSWDFMQKANAEAHRRNVQGIESIGGVARAIGLIINGK
jgi:hypothetical protein